MAVRIRGSSFRWLVGCLCVLAARPALAFDEATADRALQFAREQVDKTAHSGLATNRYPKNSTDSTWVLNRNDELTAWTQGFFPGLLWYMYEQGRDPNWKAQAEAWTQPLEGQKTNTQTHDLGFKFMPSFGQAYRLTGEPADRDVLLTAARSLATRFNSAAGVISCCSWNPAWQVPVVTDTMMNIELLFWASRNGGDPAWNDMALRHALTTLRDMVRPDGGTFHVVDYDTSGRIRSRGTFQGYSDSSTWSRGQAWAIYGFTMAYRYTRDPRMLEAAQKVTNYYLDRLPPDFVPFWDFNAPQDQQVKDSSAAAVVASALQELSTYVTDPTVAQRYKSAALSMLDSLCSPAYLAQGSSSPGILLHGVAFYKTAINPRGDAIDKSLIYGDYYFVEALLRFKQSVAGGWYSTLSFPGSLHTLGSGNTGVQVAEFEVTPLSKPIDAVIGYADSSADVTSEAKLAMALRMNPSGSFDVRRGTDYAALTSVPYEANTSYHVRVRADLDAKTYSVWITPPGASEVLLADGFAFQAGAPPTDELGQVSVRSARFDKQFRVSGHTVKPEGASPNPNPSPSEPGTPTPGETMPPQEPQPSPPTGPGCRAASGSAMVMLGLLSWVLWSRRRPRTRG